MSSEKNNWTFLSNHSHVLVCLAGDSMMRMRDVATKVGITERAVQRIVADLEGAGALKRSRIGRQNQYEIVLDSPLRHNLESHRTIGDILEAIMNIAPLEHAVTQSVD
jgi:DNA-binding Lrp family transcriptional regulator